MQVRETGPVRFPFHFPRFQRVFGTSDGQNSEAAGYVGFRQPSTASARLYQRLIQLRYDPAWMRWGDFGSHTGAMSTAFAPTTSSLRS